MSAIPRVRVERRAPMRKWLSVGRATLLFALVLLFVRPPLASGQTAGLSRLQNDDPNNWAMYHRSYDAFRFSPLAQINKDNVKNLPVAWVHQPGAIVQGLEATPLVVDGVMYYIASYNRVFALDGATGKELWHFYPKLDPVVNTLFFQPYNRGVAVAHGRVYFGGLDGRVFALPPKTGKAVSGKQVLPTKKSSSKLTPTPLLGKDKGSLRPT